MTPARTAQQRPLSGPSPHLSIADLVLLRVAAGGASRAELQRDLAPLVAPKTPGTLFRQTAEIAIGTHGDQQLLIDVRGRLSATAAGLRAADALLVTGQTRERGWTAVRDALVAQSLGRPAQGSAGAKALERAESLSGLVLQQHFKLPSLRPLSTTDLRAALAVVALERAFGNKIKTGLAKGSGLPGKTGRLLAGQLFKPPRELATDGKLVLALAADVSGASDTTLDALKLALLRRLTQMPDAGPMAQALRPPRARTPQWAPDNDAAPLAPQNRPITRTPVRPDMLEFAGAVVDAARPISEGWPGNRKAFISRTWRAIRSTRPEWELTEIAFKSMLAEAHRSGQLMLTTADLKDRCDLKELEDSKILYKNTVWHFVRVED